MDFVKREDQNPSDEDQYKAYLESLQKHQPETDYQHTPISMEQLHQVMQSSFNANSLHGFQLPLSPRQMSTLMLKTNHLSRNINFNEIPAHLPRNLAMSQEHDLIQSLAHELPQGLRHEDLIGQNLMIARNLSQDLELTSLTQSILQNQSLNEQELSRNLNNDLTRSITNMSSDLSQNLSRIHEILPQNLRVDLAHNLTNELTLTLRQEVLEESRRSQMLNMQVDQSIPQTRMDHSFDHNETQNLSQNQRISQVLTQNLAQSQHVNQNLTHSQRLDQNLTQSQRIDQNLTQSQRIDQSLAQTRLENVHLLPMPFHIKSEQDDEYFYDGVNQQGISVNGLNGQIAIHNENQDHHTGQPYSHQQNMYVYSNSGTSTANIPALNPIDLYTRPQNYIQNYTRDNPQNLVIQKQFENYSEDFRKIRQDGAQNGAKEKEQPKENLKPSDQNKIFYNEYNTVFIHVDKTDENNSIDDKLTISEDLSLIKGEYSCYKCNQIFPSKRGLKTHSKICADGEIDEVEKLGKFSCTQCSYRCQSPAILKIHERTHTGEKPFSCTFCDYKSGQKNNVAKHILVHMKEKPFRCQYCDYRCAQKNNLVVHERTHTGYKPFACSFCDYRTVQKPNLVKHMYLHTDQKPFACDQCNYRCVQKTNLTKHKLRHLNEKDGDKVEYITKPQIKPYRPRQKSVKCPYCPYKCVQKSSLEKHLQFKHGGESTEILHDNFDQNSLLLDENNSQEIQNLSVKKDLLSPEEKGISVPQS